MKGDESTLPNAELGFERHQVRDAWPQPAAVNVCHVSMDV